MGSRPQSGVPKNCHICHYFLKKAENEDGRTEKRLVGQIGLQEKRMKTEERQLEREKKIRDGRLKSEKEVDNKARC